MLDQPSDLVLNMLNILHEAGDLDQPDAKGSATPAQPPVPPRLEALAGASSIGS